MRIVTPSRLRSLGELRRGKLRNAKTAYGTSNTSTKAFPAAPVALWALAV